LALAEIIPFHAVERSGGFGCLVLGAALMAWTIVPIKIADELLMSALGQKRTFGRFIAMSALPPKADITERD
jgi:hypothetical protein